MNTNTQIAIAALVIAALGGLAWQQGLLGNNSNKVTLPGGVQVTPEQATQMGYVYVNNQWTHKDTLAAQAAAVANTGETNPDRMNATQILAWAQQILAVLGPIACNIFPKIPDSLCPNRNVQPLQQSKPRTGVQLPLPYSHQLRRFMTTAEAKTYFNQILNRGRIALIK